MTKFARIGSFARFARFTRFAAGVALAVTISAPLLAQQAPAIESTPLTRALDSVRADRILADVFYIACDEMGGRDTPSNGLRLTARFLKNRLQRLGWRPGAKEGWFQTYPLSFKRVQEPETHATASAGEQKLELEFAVDYFFRQRDLETAETTAGVVGCGRGAKQDFEAAPAVRGKWALVVDPGDRTNLDEFARGAGAVGVLLLPRAEVGAEPTAESFAFQLSALRSGQATWPEETDAKKSPFLPRVYLTKAAGSKLLALAGVQALTVAVNQELPIVFSDMRRMQGDGKIQCENVCAFWPGSDPELGKQFIIISAHYDHVGIGANGQVYNGADDNGSGTSGLLALAEALVFQGPLRRSVMLIWVSGEEKGLYGSQAWAAAPWLPNDGRPIADINIDMIGRNAPNQILLTPSKEHAAYNGLSKLAERCVAEEGFIDIASADAFYSRSDHVNFAKLGIPITFLFNDVHADYHKPTDDAEKIDGDKIRRVVRAVIRMLDAMQDDDLALGQ